MAEFCLQCNQKNGIDFSDFAGETGYIEYYIFKRAALVICEGCGPVCVDPKGRCISPDCPVHTKEQQS